MDPKPAPAGKPSALPRPQLSKLPTPRSTRLPQPQNDNSSLPNAKPTLPTPGFVRKPSIAALPKSSQSVASTKPALSRIGTANGSGSVAKSGIGATVGKYQKRHISATSTASSLSNEGDENVDRVASLDSFRSSSRQGSRLGHRDDSPLDTIEYVEQSEVTSNGQPRRPSRPSLSDRTIGSLQSVPTTPKDRRRSSFFNPVESPMGPPPRPGSSLSRAGSGDNGSRPGTSDGTIPKLPSRASSPSKRQPASAQPSTRATSKLPSFGATPSSKRVISGGLTSKLQKAQTPLSQKTASIPKSSASGTGLGSKIGTGSKTIASSRPAKPRPSLGQAFKPAKESPSKQEDSTTVEPKRVVSNSSAALREQIAAAKAAARKEKAAKHDSPQDFPARDDVESFEYDVHADPFNQAPRDDKHVLRNRIRSARVDGRLNIAALGLKNIPGEVRSMYSSKAMEESNVNWAEVVDLTKLIAADNEFVDFDDTVFPDRSPEDLDADDTSEGNQFGGLEVLDLHGNMLQTVPMGLRRLERLTKLDLAHNKLDNAAFDVISQMKSLKELKLGHNSLTGNVPISVCELPNLEVLDLQENRLLSLPEALRELVCLRVLNVAGNQLTDLPMDALQQLPLVELDASSNALIASLFPLSGPNGHSTLQTLNVANNSLAALTFLEPLLFPQLRSLNITNNHMTALPTMNGWVELLTLLAGDNKIVELPPGFTTLQKLRNVNLSSNDLRTIDPEVARMTSLDSFILAANPLRERKFLTMNAADIKRDLRSRLLPEHDDDEPGSPVTVIGDFERPCPKWLLKGNGVLDLASRSLSDDASDDLEQFLESNEVKRIELQSNNFGCIPLALRMGLNLRALDISDNAFGADYLLAGLELPCLQELNLSRCRLVSLEPLLDQLQAPALQTLNISANRLSGTLPSLRYAYSSLITLFANDNRLISISADALRGFQTVNLDSNDIEQLPAEIGLLWDEGLKSFSVSHNAFRVPNYRILEKGTDATLRWLRNKLPASADAGVIGEEYD